MNAGILYPAWEKKKIKTSSGEDFKLFKGEVNG